MSRITWYTVFNIAFSLAVAIAASGSTHGVHPLYLILLFALCSSFIVDVGRWNDRYGLLALFSLAYFMFYGVVDFQHLLGLDASTASDSDGVLLSTAELVILGGGCLAQISYRIACRLRPPPHIAHPGDWPESWLLWVGLPLFLICTTLKWITHVYLFPTNDSATAAVELAKVGNLGMLVITVGDMLQPLSMLLIFYALCRYRRRVLLPIALAAVAIQAVYGFVIDVKGEVLIGGVLLILTKVLVNGRLPKTWIVTAAISIALIFPALQANRVLRGENNIDHAQAASDIIHMFEDAYAARHDITTGNDRTQTFFERSSLKGSVEMIVQGTGTSVPYQNGYTLSPLIAAFIPKIIWPTKPDVPVGRVLNQQFHVTSDEDTYISPSHLGELYWNFGWTGIVVGMILFGLLLGYIGARADMSERVTLSRVLVLAITARLLIMGFESSIANQYVVWGRTMIAIALLRLMFARPLADPLQQVADPDLEASSRPFSNLMA